MNALLNEIFYSTQMHCSHKRRIKRKGVLGKISRAGWDFRNYLIHEVLYEQLSLCHGQLQKYLKPMELISKKERSF